MELLTLSALDLRRALPMAPLIDAMRDVFLRHARGKTQMPARVVLSNAQAESTLLMGADVEGMGRTAKVVSVFPGNKTRGLETTTGLLLVLDPSTGEPAALCDGGALTALRTGAVTGLATEILSSPDAESLALIGTGGQAWTQLLGICTVRTIREVAVYSREPSNRETFLERIRQEWCDVSGGTPPSFRVRSASTAEDAVAGAAIVCAATNSPLPVLRGHWLLPGVHVNGVGSYRLDMREVDGDLVARSRVVVDDRNAAIEEAGDLMQAETEGRTHRSEWTELGSLLEGSGAETSRRKSTDLGADPETKPGHDPAKDLTFFKSVGLAIQDVGAGHLALKNARALGLGTTLRL